MNDFTPQQRNANFVGLCIWLMQGLLYVLIQILFIPLACIGLIVGVYKEFVVGKKRGISYSAGQTLQYRWFMHYFDTRPDPLTIKFTKKFPCESHWGLWSFVAPLTISRKLFGFRTKLNKLPEPGKETLATTAAMRVITFDQIMENYIDSVDQIVIPGVGFDLIAHHFAEGKSCKVFEIDQVNTLNIKIDTLKKAEIKHDWITYVPVDYEKERWVDKLLGAGFDKTKKTLFLWQSVSHFLDENIVKQTLKEMAELSADGSIIAQDFYSKSFIFDDASLAVKSQRNMMSRMGETWKFGIDMSHGPSEAIELFLRDCGLQAVSIKQFGKDLGIVPFYCIVEAVKIV